MEINNSNLVSTNNSSSTPLAGGATFTGTGENISDYAAFSIQVFASHASATDGLSMEFSTDNVNWDERHVATVDATTSREFTFPAHAKFARVVYTNGPTLQTSFRLQTILHVQTLNGTSHHLDGAAFADDVAIINKSVIMAQGAGSGLFIPVQATAGGNFKVSIEEVDGAIAGGGIEATALRVTMANNSTGQLSVNATSVIPGAGATNLGKAEDAVHSSGDVGVMALGVRTDVPVSRAADGDYTPLQMSEEGALWTENLPSEVDAGNSSTSTLIADAVFTGTGVDILDHQVVTVILNASHDSATDGMQFQFSPDGTNWDYINNFTYTVNGGRIFQFGVYARYFRIVYTNGGTDQTHFRCQTLLHHETTLTTIHRLVDNESPDRSAEITKSIVIAQSAGTGDFVPVQATTAGNFKMSLEEVDGAIAGGGTESDALRVTMASDSTGLLSVVSGVSTSGGTTLYKNIDVDETEDQIKATAGQVYWIHATNLSAAVLYLKLYNATAANVTVGTTVPDLTFPIPTQGDTNGAGFTLSPPSGIAFGTAITVAATTGIADNNSGAPGANTVILSLGYA